MGSRTSIQFRRRLFRSYRGNDNVLLCTTGTGGRHAQNLHNECLRLEQSVCTFRHERKSVGGRYVWSRIFGNGLSRVAMLAGESSHDGGPSKAHLIIGLPEHWDRLSRRWSARRRSSVASSYRTICIFSVGRVGQSWRSYFLGCASFRSRI